MSTTFFGCPSGTDGNIVMLGIPFDHGSTAHPGCADAPNLLRLMTSKYDLKSRDLFDKSTNQKILSARCISDFGDITYQAEQYRLDYFQNITLLSQSICDSRKIAFSIGGDHLATLPLIKGAVASADSPIQVIQIDAHTDYNKIKQGCSATHANFMYEVSTLTHVKKVIQIGVRGIDSPPNDLPRHIIQTHVSQLAQHLIPNIPTYLTIDTDGFNPVQFSGVSFPEPGGLVLSDLDNILNDIYRCSSFIIGVDWMEYNPKYDTRNMITGKHIIQGVLKILSILGRHHV